VNFYALASLLLPATPERTAVVLEADEDWSFDVRGFESDVVVWGRGPAPSGMPLSALTRAALARERALRRLRRDPPYPLHVSWLHRLTPSTLQQRYRERARAAVLGGAVVQLTKADPVLRVLDLAADAAGGVTPVGAFTAGSGGSILTRLAMRDGSEAMLRVGAADGASDPSKGAEALQWLATAGIPAVPRSIGSGHSGHARWTLESRLQGARVGGLSAAVLHDVARFCARLPAGSGPPTAATADIGRIAAAFPVHANLLATVSSLLRPALRSLPAVGRHGDLWSGNILVERGTLAGIVDWDNWHPSGVPGTDLLHAFAMEESLRSGRELGSVWLGAPWRTPSFAQLTSAYWPALDVWPDAATLQAVGIAWWAGFVAHSIARDPTLVADARWSRLNVDDVLASLARTVL
jgi:Phosphotransferase enzyme family